MTAQQLKNSILQLAVQGKLVPQDPNDEPASVLLECIRAEKQRLVKDGKIKKDKNESVIYRAPREGGESADNLPYADLPFDIPDSWVWVRLGEIMNVVSAHRVHQADWKKSGVPFFRAREIAKLAEFGRVENELFISQELYEDFSKSGVPHENDLMVTAVGTIGKTYIVKKDEIFYYKDASVVCFENFANINAQYMKLLMESPYMVEQIKENSAGTTVDTITIIKANKYYIALPPLSEQQRIVACIEELLPHIADYNVAEQKLTALNTTFPDQLKKSILQSAVQGKLVPQDPADEPASALLERIRAEKEAQIKAGKIKRDKHESVIFRRDNSHYEKLDGIERCIDDEIPFDVPETWAWARLKQIGEIVGGGTPKTENAMSWRDGSIAWLTPADMKFVRKYVTCGERNITEFGLQHSSARLMPKDTIIYSSRAPIGYTAIAANDLCTNQGFKSLVPMIEGLSEYIYYVLICFTPEIQSRASGTTFKEISGTEFGLTIIPLPPLAEQHRIVERIEQLTAITKKL
jgi:type I restriction enzyme S subunit